MPFDYSSSEEFERQGFELYSHGDHEAAIKIFKRGLVHFPAVPEFYEGIGDCYFDIGEYALAHRYYRRGLSFAPEHAAMLVGLGSCCLMLGKPEAAILCFDRFRSIGSDNLDMFVIVARNLYELEKFEEAIECCDAAIGSEPGCAEAYFCKAAALSCLGADLYETEPLFKTALALEPREDMVCYYGNVLYENRQYKKALSVFETVAIGEIEDIISLDRMIKLYKRYKNKDREITSCRRRIIFLSEQETFEGFVRSLAHEWEIEDRVNNKGGRLH